jgi:hypothetical protein
VIILDDNPAGVLQPEDVVNGFDAEYTEDEVEEHTPITWNS